MKVCLVIPIGLFNAYLEPPQPPLLRGEQEKIGKDLRNDRIYSRKLLSSPLVR